MSVTVSLVKYLNTAPLHWGMTHGPCGGGMNLRFDTPAECARLIACGEAAAGHIPAAEYQNMEGLEVLPGMSISSWGPVQSVVLLARRPAEKVERVALDESSRTSAILVRLLLDRIYDNRPRFVSMPPDIKVMLSGCDAALLIGDPAMRAARKGLYCYDLASEWARLTGLPFVFAFWAIRPSPEVAALLPSFYRSRQYGLARLEEIAAAESGPRGIPVNTAFHYLRDHIDFSLGPAHREGMRLFYRMAWEHGLLPEPRPLVFTPLP